MLHGRHAQIKICEEDGDMMLPDPKDGMTEEVCLSHDRLRSLGELNALFSQSVLPPKKGAP